MNFVGETILLLTVRYRIVPIIDVEPNKAIFAPKITQFMKKYTQLQKFVDPAKLYNRMEAVCLMVSDHVELKFLILYRQ